MNLVILTVILSLIGWPAQSPAPDPQAEFVKAIETGHVSEIRELLEMDSSLATAEAPGGTSLLLYALYHRQPQIAALLLAYRRSHLTVFESAAMGEMSELRSLLQHDPKLVDAVSSDGFTPLHLASFFGRTEAQELLISSGAPLERHSQNSLNATPLQSAVAARQLKSASVLLSHHADPNSRGEAGYTPLFEAAESGQIEVLLLLLKHGADPSLEGTDGKTAMDVATAAHQVKAQEILLKGKV